MKKRILLVDDDPVVLRMYQEALKAHGFETETANDGIGAIQQLRTSKPDLVVLDLMMPRFTGLDVLKFMRGQPALKEVPVILLSNSFMNDLAGQAVAVGVQRALLKMRCSPPYLVGLINDVLQGRSGSADPSQLLAVPKVASLAAPASVAGLSESVATERAAVESPAEGRVFGNHARKELLANAAKIRADLNGLVQGFSRSTNPAESEMRLNDFYRRVHFLTVAAGMAGAQDIALLASAFEALLFEIMSRPALITPSVRRTVAFTTDFLGLLLQRAKETQATTPPSPQALVVDDDPLSNRLVTAALRRAQLTPRSTEDPLQALEWVCERHYDLVLLDIEMPGIDGFEFCKQLRQLKGYSRTPVVFVTSHGDFDSRAQSVLSGGNDLIAKPVLPIELAVKAVMHLLKSDLESRAAAAS
jgi:CheY-like chemotaxis protein